MNKLVELQSVTAGYGHDIILHDVNLIIDEQDFLGLIGPNGGGKTTLLKLILGLITPLEGRITFYFDHRFPQNSIGYLQQFKAIDAAFPIRVRDVVLSGLVKPFSLRTRFTREDYRRADRILDQVGILHLAGNAIGELSGGQMQRVFLGRALIASPRLLLLDEPNTFVDINFEHSFYEILKELNRNMAIVLVSHDLGLISSYVKNIACVNRGVHYHPTNIIDQQVMNSYNCPFDLITHGPMPHRVLLSHPENE
ncbi:MAG: ABC transporter ATP-binding protein [Candidatus Delongbacteria bacterium]|nr:ABC transporter ATP-binding protein [Candidatus Delongbacteria bacterium]